MDILANNEESLIKEIENDINDFYDISSNMVKTNRTISANIDKIFSHL